MRLRRVRRGSEVALEAQRRDGAWSPHPDATPLGGAPFDSAWQTAMTAEHSQRSEHLLPFQPLSFRDFMLYEKHVIDASRGLAARFHPDRYRDARDSEQRTGTTFDGFMPNPLFYRQPIYYMSNHLTFVPTGMPLNPPPYSEALDYELELGFVLAKPLCNATAEEALEAIGSFVVLNDVSARDVQEAEMRSGFGPQRSKHFLNSMSATAVTADEVLPRIDSLTGSVAINGRTVSTVSSSGLHWTLGQAVAHVSQGERLLPGELFGTGTLPGGSGMETGNWIRAGDTLTLTIDDIGIIEHDIRGS